MKTISSILNRIQKIFIGHTRYWIGILILIMAAGCDRAAVVEKMTPPEDEAVARGYIDLLRQEEFEQIEEDIDPSITDENLHSNLVMMNKLFPAEDPESIKVIGVQINRGQDSSMTNITYEYQYPDKVLLVNVAVQKKGETSTIVGFNVNLMQESLENLNRFTLAGKSALHYLVLILAILLPLFSIYALVLCIRTKMEKRKWLWIIFILLGISEFSLNWTTGETSFTLLAIQLLSAGIHSSGFGPWIISISLPLGAIIFLSRRGKLTKTAEANFEVAPSENIA